MGKVGLFMFFVRHLSVEFWEIVLGIVEKITPTGGQSPPTQSSAKTGLMCRSLYICTPCLLLNTQDLYKEKQKV